MLEGHDGLPKLLMRETGLNSGFMIPQYTAAALVSENKVLCHPASVDSIPTSLGQEDHVSMGSVSALKLLQVFENVETVLAIEVLTAAQALDYRLPLRPGRGVEAAHRLRARRDAAPRSGLPLPGRPETNAAARAGQRAVGRVGTVWDAARMTSPVEHWWTNARLATMRRASAQRKATLSA